MNTEQRESLKRDGVRPKPRPRVRRLTWHSCRRPPRLYCDHQALSVTFAFPFAAVLTPAALLWSQYIIVRNAISKELVAELNKEVDLRLTHEFGTANIDKRVTYANGALQPSHGQRGQDVYSPIPGWDEEPLWGGGGHVSTQAWRELIDPPSMSPIVGEILGDPVWEHIPDEVPVSKRGQWRLDHDNLHVAPKWPGPPGTASAGGGIHGGPGSHHITCVYELIDVEPGMGGFGCIPGSHERSFDWSSALSIGSREEWRNPVDGDWPSEVGVRRLELNAGDCMLFTEKLSHCTVPWSGNRQRRTIFFKYVPYGMHHVDRAYDMSDPDLTPSQRSRLEFPETWFNKPGRNSPFFVEEEEEEERTAKL